MEIAVKHEQGKVPVTVFQLKGDLTAEEPLRSQAEAARNEGTRYLLLDLTNVPYISSAGLRVLHHIYTNLRDQSTAAQTEDIPRGILSGTYHSPNLKLLKPSKNAMKAISVAGFDMFLEIHDDYKKALASFG
jgi:anti-anti-sigma factor